ncbi:Zinc finger protein, partial [Armadillidium vulgare]
IIKVGNIVGREWKSSIASNTSGHEEELKPNKRNHGIDEGCNQKRHLKVHMLKHSGTKLFECPQCDHKCNIKSNLKKHMLRHIGIKLFKCCECEYDCYQKRHLTLHMAKHNNI